MHATFSRTSCRPPRGAFTVIEVMIVIVLLSIVAALFLPQLRPSAEERLYSAAHVVAADIQHCRGLAVGNGSQYRIDFDAYAGRYELSHAGADNALDALPSSPFLTDAVGSSGQPVQYFDLGQHPGAGGVRIHEVTRAGTPGTPALEFTPLGALAASEQAAVWLTTGIGDSQRFLPVHVNSTTGAVRVGSVSSFDAGGGGP